MSEAGVVGAAVSKSVEEEPMVVVAGAARVVGGVSSPPTSADESSVSVLGVKISDVVPGAVARGAPTGTGADVVDPPHDAAADASAIEIAATDRRARTR